MSNKALAGRVDTGQFQRLAGKSSRLAPKVKSNLRRNLKGIGDVVVTAMRAELSEPPLDEPKHERLHTGLRDDIAVGLKITIATGNRAGIIIGNTTNDQAHPRGLVIGYGKIKGFRHPVGGNSDVWVQQRGRPYFGPVADRYREKSTRAVVSALKDAAATLQT